MDACNNNKQPLIGIVGPTACGKTGLAVAVCQALGGEVVSCDSMQVYRGMDIAVAMPTKEERAAATHHLIDFVERDTPFSAAQYCALAHACIAELAGRGVLPVVCGGTGLYFHSLVDNLQFSAEGRDPQLRERLQQQAQEFGAQALLARLAAIDPVYASGLHVNNLGRIIRALEIWQTTGQTPTVYREKAAQKTSPYKAAILGITARERQTLYTRIDARVDAMLANGLLEEAQQAYRAGYAPTARQAIGHKELFGYFAGDCSLAQAVDSIKRETRRYAKRQLTWFQRDTRIHWLYLEDYETQQALHEAAIALLQRKNTGKEAQQDA